MAASYGLGWVDSLKRTVTNRLSSSCSISGSVPLNSCMARCHDKPAATPALHVSAVEHVVRHLLVPGSGAAPCADGRDGHVVRQRTRTGNLDAVVKHLEQDLRAGDGVVAMHDRIDQRLPDSRQRQERCVLPLDVAVFLESPEPARPAKRAVQLLVQTALGFADQNHVSRLVAATVSHALDPEIARLGRELRVLPERQQARREWGEASRRTRPRPRGSLGRPRTAGCGSVTTSKPCRVR